MHLVANRIISRILVAKDFHTICRGIGCVLDDICNECECVKLEVMFKCINHKESLKKKSRSKQKANEKLLSKCVMDDELNVSDVTSSVDVPMVSVDVLSACFDFFEIDRRETRNYLRLIFEAYGR